jgi:aryl-alcohol dehydrogenase-like predicted oxidoreductase
MSWVAGQPGASTVLVGATTPEQVQANVTAIGWSLTADDRAQIDVVLSDTGEL